MLSNIKKIIQKLLFFFLTALVWLGLAFLALMLFLILINTFFVMFKGLLDFINPNSIFKTLIKINFRYIISSALFSFIISLTTLAIVFFIVEKVSKNKTPEAQRKRAAFLWNGITALFLSLTLIFALDEAGFTIATSIVSFFALLWPLTKEYWMEQFPLNQFLKSEPEEKNKNEQE